MTHDNHDSIRALRWQDDRLRLLDQRCLPSQECWIDCTSAASVAQAIRDLVVRGAPAIGIAAAWGVVLAARVGARELEAAWSLLR
ncbi:MAG: S-methyl-5-thioribose-1-phosphate isomerase, partial [Rhodanobacteraceae bacterium]